MRYRTLDEMVSYFNREVSKMDIDQSYKIQLLGMVSAIAYSSQKPRWIPCSERLPEVRHDVLITDGNHTSEGQLQDNGDWIQYRWVCKRKHGEIIAWMPLPEPYRTEE